MNEIKINNPSLKFPIKLSSQKEEETIENKLINRGFIFINKGEKIPSQRYPIYIKLINREKKEISKSWSIKETMSTGGGAAGETNTPIAARKKTSQDENSPTGFESSPKPNMYTKTMKFKIVNPKDRINSVDLWDPKKGQPKFDNMNENKYSKFRKKTKSRKPQEQLHIAVKEIQMKMDEVNRLVEFTSKMKQELKEDESGLKYLKKTTQSISKIQQKITQINNKIKTLIE